MTLADLLPKLAKNDEKQVCIKTQDNQTIITFNPSGYTGLSAELNARTVNEIMLLDSQNLIVIYLTNPEDTTNIPSDSDQPSGSEPTP